MITDKDVNPSEGKTEIVQILNLDHSTLFPIHFELQSLSQVTADFRHHSPPCPPAFD
ncbi:hypothetical protein [Nostoc sp.]|uniref:hypothetical protein n=1 Tax=Nostoc sp. TaxID=1180 RepID=UPI002FFC74CC